MPNELANHSPVMNWSIRFLILWEERISNREHFVTKYRLNYHKNNKHCYGLYLQINQFALYRCKIASQ